MTLMRNLFLIVILLLMTACASSQLYHQQLVALDKGMNQSQATAVLQQSPISVHESTVEGIRYTFHRYYLNNGRFGDVYLLCFEGEKLKYWGYIEEFRRYPDPRINKAMDEVLAQIRATKG